MVVECVVCMGVWDVVDCGVWGECGVWLGVCVSSDVCVCEVVVCVECGGVCMVWCM